MADWATYSELATGVGTMVLAVATFASVRTSSRAARVAERALMAQQRPVLAPSRDSDEPERIMFGDRHWVTVTGHGAAFEAVDDHVYMALPLRNIGEGIAVLHGWIVRPGQVSRSASRGPTSPTSAASSATSTSRPATPGSGRGRSASPEDPDTAGLLEAARNGDPLVVLLLYGDLEGGQRTIARFTIIPDEEVAA